MDLAEKHRLIDDVIRQRSRALHEGNRRLAAALDEDLIDMLKELPDNKPNYPEYLYTGQPNAWGRFPDEQIKRLQWVKGDNAFYVPLAKWREEDYFFSPTPRHIRLANEASRSAEVLAQIQQLEALGKQASVAADFEEAEPGVQGDKRQ